MNTPDIIETAPNAITLKQGGAVWLISTSDGLISLYKTPALHFVPVTLFIRSQGRIEARVMWMHPNGGYVGSEF